MNRKSHQELHKPLGKPGAKVHYTANIIYIDEETGELLTLTQYNNGNYIKTFTTKDYAFSKDGTKCKITWNQFVKRNPQLRIL